VWNSTLVIDAATGIARAEFSALPTGFGPRFLVFTATPEMAFFMTRPGGLTPACGPVPHTSWLGSGSWAYFTGFRAPHPFNCTFWNCGAVYYDLRITSGVTFGVPPAFTMTQGMLSLRSAGNPILGRSYEIVVEGGDQSPQLNWNAAIIVSDFAGNEVPLGPTGCQSIFKPATSSVSNAFFGPNPAGSSVSIPNPVPLSAPLLGMAFFQQAILVSDIGGVLQTRPSAQILSVTLGW
jgi:hypothetical protein